MGNGSEDDCAREIPAFSTKEITQGTRETMFLLSHKYIIVIQNVHWIVNTYYITPKKVLPI